LWYSCRQNLVWQTKKCLARQDSCVLVFLTDSCFNICSCISCMNLFSCSSCLIPFFSWMRLVYCKKKQKICTLQRTEKNNKKCFIYLKK
jgi:hypothetical protein